MLAPANFTPCEIYHHFRSDIYTECRALELEEPDSDRKAHQPAFMLHRATEPVTSLGRSSQSLVLAY